MVSEGIYRIVFGGSYSSGVGLLMLRQGTLIGTDVQGATYRGTYREAAGNEIAIHLEVTVPANTPLVTGEHARSVPWALPIDATLRANFASGMPINITTEAGLVSVTLSLLQAI
jgi:hypothetical protein